MRRRQARAGRQRAFTLLEVLMVIVILGILAALVVPQLGRQEERAKIDMAKIQVTGTLVPKLEAFRLNCGRYPTADEGLRALLEQPDDEEIADRWAGPYVTPEQLKDPWGREFIYRIPGEYNEQSFDIASPGPDGEPDNEDDIGNWQKAD